MNQLPFHGNVCIIGKRTKRIYGRMDDYAGKQAPAALKNGHEHKAYRNRKNDLAQIACQAHAAAVEQVDNMPYAERYA